MVVGFDGIPESEFYYPSLTTVYQDQNKLGCIAVEELVKMVAKDHLSGDVNEPRHVMIQPDLIISASTANL
jgi:DNA-binding LacI/PurR family transcriptional regulator